LVDIASLLGTSLLVKRRGARLFSRWLPVTLILSISAASPAVAGIVPACAGYTGWSGQTNPPTDAAGTGNTGFPEASSTSYFSAILNAAIGSVVTIHGQYPLSRFMSLAINTPSGQEASSLSDYQIQPDPGQNNPFISGTKNGTFTAYLVFGPEPSTPAANTIYTGTLTNVNLIYRVYHTTNPNDPAGSATNPVTPDLSMNGQPLSNCPVQPILPANSTPWDRLDLGDWMGTLPTAAQQFNANANPTWRVVNPSNPAHLSPNGSDFYMDILLSRQFLAPNTGDNLFVIHFEAPTFPNTRAGAPPYANEQVRFWSICTDDPYTTNVNRCDPDDSVTLDSQRGALIVISDPGSEPSQAAMTQFKATWLPWGALDLPTDVVYDGHQQPWGIDTPVQYYNFVFLRQTLANPAFTQSMAAVSLLPTSEQQAAMGAYWPVSGYCSTAAFEARGARCLSGE